MSNVSGAKGLFKGLRIESRAMKYGYSNARVRAMKGLLLNDAALNDLIKVQTVEGMAELLQRSDYKTELANSPSGVTGSRLIELAATRTFAQTVRRVLKFTPKRDQAIVRILMLKWDLLNLKTLIHAKRLKQSYDEVKPLLFVVGGMDEEDFKCILKADEKMMLYEIRKTVFGQQILSAERLDKKLHTVFVAAFKSLDGFLDNETALDSSIYALMDTLVQEGGKDVSRIRDILRHEVDAKNILIVERLKRKNADKEKVKASLIKGGTLSVSMVDRLIEAKDLPATISLLKSRFSKISLDGAASSATNELVLLEVALEKAIAAQKVSAFHQDMLSIGVIIGFLLLKEEEVHNLRKIAKAKEFGIPEDEVRGMLVSI